jgi:hypothetical protein
VLEQLVGQGAEVDVGAFGHAGGGDVLVGGRPGIISGIHSFITALSSVYSISAKAWCC